MSELLDRVMDAHGGKKLWDGFEEVHATIVTGGDLWGIKGLKQDSQPRHMRVKLHEQWASVEPFGGPGQFTDFTRNRIAILKSDGTLVAEHAAPRRLFEGHGLKTPWGPLHRAYFNGYALWTYQTTPFLLACDGVEVKEIDSWREGNETWRVLRAVFPDTMDTHSATQYFFFGADYLLRRHDYTVDVAGGFGAAQLITEYTEANGLKLPARRRAYLRDSENRPELNSLMVSIDLTDIRFE